MIYKNNQKHQSTVVAKYQIPPNETEKNNVDGHDYKKFFYLYRIEKVLRKERTHWEKII